MDGLPGYQQLELLGTGECATVYRALRQDGTAVVLKTTSAPIPSAQVLARFQREYALLRALTIEGVPRVVALEHHQNRPFLVVESVGDRTPLGRLLDGGRLAPSDCLTLGIHITEVLGRLHAEGILHRALNPSHVLCARDLQSVVLVGFSQATVATGYPSVAQLSLPPEGQLAFVSPEQTGRMNRSVDHRSDFYSLGAVIYTMLLGRPPFDATDPVELVHAHLAREPIAPHHLDSNIPTAISEVVLKLLRKTAEERYQSARGIRHDLVRCLDIVTGHATDLSVGMADVADRFCLPGKLYGRTEDFDVLLAAFERIHLGGRELVTVSGPSGIGKSALIQELGKPLSRTRGSFLSGKFEQYRRNVPYSALVSALDQWVRQVLVQPPSQVSLWQERLRDALGDSAKLLTDLVTSLQWLIGPQPEVAELPPQEAQFRFDHLFQRLFRVLCQSDEPLVLFLDDLQWADTATLRLFEQALSDEPIRHLLVLGAYRSNEVDAAHPLMVTLDRLKRASVRCTRIRLSSLSRHHVTELVADTVRQEPESVVGLSDLVMSKTRGNPFFVKQFLRSLYDDHLLTFTPGGWHWDLQCIQAKGITDNVVELVLARLRALPETTQRVLRLAACIGNTFDLRTLSLILEATEDVTLDALRIGLREGLVTEQPESGSASEMGTVRFRFIHDRVQQAAHELIAPTLRATVHYRIGKLLLEQWRADEQEERLFELVDHLNEGQSILGDPEERRNLVNLNLRAACKAKVAAAYAAGLDYIDTAVRQLGPEIWTDPSLGLAVCRERAELTYLNADYVASRECIEAIWQHAESRADRVAAKALLVVQWTMLGDNEEAIRAAASALALYSIEFPEPDQLTEALARELHAVKSALGARPIASLIDAPRLDDVDRRAQLKVLSAVHTAIYFAGHYELYAWTLARMAHTSLVYGHAPESSKGYASFGNVLTNFWGEPHSGHEFVRLAIELARQDGQKALLCKNCLILSMFVNHWIHPLRTAEPFDDIGQEAGMEAGDFQFVGYILAYGKTFNHFHRGSPLGEIESKAREYEEFCRRVHHNLSGDNIAAARRVVAALTGTGPHSDFNASGEAEFLRACRANGSLAALAFYFTERAHVDYLYGRWQSAWDALEQATPLLVYVRGVFITAEHLVLRSLLTATRLASLTPHEQTTACSVLADNEATLKSWAELNPDNFRHKLLLVQAETAWRLAQSAGTPDSSYAAAVRRSGELFDEAAQAAERNGFAQDQALAYLRAGEMYLAEGRQQIARAYFEEAREAFGRWGAQGLVRHLDAHPLLARQSSPALLDLEAVMRAARAVSREIVLDNLLERLIRLAIETGGAQRGVLLLAADDAADWHAEVEGVVEGGDILVRRVTQSVTPPNLPWSVIHYVANTKRSVVLDDARNTNDFREEPYIAAQEVCSILCLPLLNRGQASGMLYLDNRLTRGAFSSDRLQVLEVLASQAAVAIDNARLYGTLEQKVKERTEQLSNALSALTLIQTQLESANAGLEERVRERTAELLTSNERLRLEIQERENLERRLRHAQKLEAIGTLAGGFAHDFNNILSAVLGCVELALLEKDPIEVQELLTETRTAGLRAADLVKQILTFSRRSEPERRPIDLGHLVVDTLKMLRASLPSTIEIVQEIEPEPLTIFADSSQIQQVLMNLGTNSAHAMANSGVLRVTLRKVDTGPLAAPAVMLAVQDSGHGMGRETLERIFDPYFTTKGPGEGTGLGLSVVHGIVTAHGGKIEVESTVGVGSNFQIFLPALEKTSVGPPVANGIGNLPNGTERILLVDDDRAVLASVEGLLLQLGYQVLSCQSSVEALDLVKRAPERFDLVLTDLTMPQLTGDQLAVAINGIQPALPVVLWTGYRFDVNERQLRERGVSRLLAKPLPLADLARSIREVLDEPSARPSGN